LRNRTERQASGHQIAEFEGAKCGDGSLGYERAPFWALQIVVFRTIDRRLCYRLDRCGGAGVWWRLSSNSWVRHVAIERLGDGGLKLGGAGAIQEPWQGSGDRSEIAAALCGADLASGRRMREAVDAVMLASYMFLLTRA
jgi:hypothetical protein